MASVQPIQLAYNKYEPDNGFDENLVPIIFLHGLTASKESWRDCAQIVANATKRTVYTVDARNHGDTEWTVDWSDNYNAIDLIHFTSCLGLRKVILIGHSMGGITAIKVALKRPDLVEKVVIEEMFVRKIPKEMIDFFFNYISIIRKAIDLAPPELDEDGVKIYVMQQYLQSIPQGWEQSKAVKNDRTEIILHRDLNGRYKFKANLELMEKALATNVDHILTENHGVFVGPALFIYGEVSEFKVGEDELHIRQYFPNAVFKGIKDASHVIHLDKPAEFVDELLKFLL